MYMKINICIIYFSQELNTLNGKVRVEITIVESINIFHTMYHFCKIHQLKCTEK